MASATVDIPELWASLSLGQRRAIIDYLADVEVVPLRRGTKGFCRTAFASGGSLTPVL